MIPLPNSNLAPFLLAPFVALLNLWEAAQSYGTVPGYHAGKYLPTFLALFAGYAIIQLCLTEEAYKGTGRHRSTPRARDWKVQVAAADFSLSG